MQRIQTQTVVIEATQAVQLDQGIVLPPGYYAAIETRSEFEAVSGDVSLKPPQYKIEFTREQLANLGARTALNLISMKVDVTKFVRSGQLTIT
jgi:hypothetical protein